MKYRNIKTYKQSQTLNLLSSCLILISKQKLCNLFDFPKEDFMTSCNRTRGPTMRRPFTLFNLVQKNNNSNIYLYINYQYLQWSSRPGTTNISKLTRENPKYAFFFQILPNMGSNKIFCEMRPLNILQLFTQRYCVKCPEKKTAQCLNKCFF